MLFIEPSFLFFFLPLFLTVYYGALRFSGLHTALATLVASSLVFYLPYGTLFFSLFVLSMTVNLAAGALLISDRIAAPRLRQAVMVAALLFDFGMLALFKYANAVWDLVSPAGASPLISYGIPAGISFYTFHQAVFIADAYYRRPEVVGFLTNIAGGARPLKGAIRYLAFASLFPQLVIGPIVYMSEFAGQMANRVSRKPRWTDFSVGMSLFVIGLFKKIVIADELGRFVDPVFESYARGDIVGAKVAWLGSLAYFAQLYFDFSGYSDMAVGIARLFGIRLPINFDSPLRATGIADFYKRWHMTLTRVIARFVFTPLSMAGTRFAMRRRMGSTGLKLWSSWTPFLLNFLAIALWHGAASTFLVFGLVHAAWYILETEVRTTTWWRGYKAKTSEATRRLAGQAITFLPLMLTFSLFRSTSLPAFGALLSSLTGTAERTANAPAMPTLFFATLALAFLTIWLLPNAYEFFRRYRPGIMTFQNPSTTPARLRFAWRPDLVWALFIMVLGIAVVANLNRPAPFLYQGF